MTQEHKELLLKDLCSRLPYGVILEHGGNLSRLDTIFMCDSISISSTSMDKNLSYNLDLDEVKPYLFPLSSMTEEQKEEYCSLQQKVIYNSKGLVNSDVMEYVNWCYKNHIDINNLIPKKLANNASGLNIYQFCDLMGVKCKWNTPPSNNPQIAIGTKIRLKTNPNVILSIISNDCHGDEFECSNGSVLSLKQIEKYYDII